MEKKNSHLDERVVVYSVTGDTLRHLGLSHISELPEYEETKKQLEVVEAEQTEPADA